MNADSSREAEPAARLLRLAVVGTLALGAFRWSALRGLGFGDAEALYASYALFPQPAYLDHPGLVGALMRAAGAGTVPSPASAHIVAAALAAGVPWVGALAARAVGASTGGALRTALALMLVPELAIGLAALTPDVPLALAWLAALAFAARALTTTPGTRAANVSWLAAGALVGVATVSKLSGVLLGAALVVTLLGAPGRRHARTLAPWAGLLLAALLASPVALWEAARGWPMIEHRLVATQAGSGLSLANIAKFTGGQLAYVGPLFVIAGALILRDVWRARTADATSALTFNALLVPGIPLALLSLWSRAAEPHWLAPALLPLALHYGRRPSSIRRWVEIGAWINGVVVIVIAWAWVRTPLPMQLLGARYEPRYDLANDLFAWGPGRTLIQGAVEDAMLETHRLPVVVGPHWIVCAQAQAALGRAGRVGCNTPIRDDFDGWLPRSTWLDEPVVLFLTDSRFTVDPARELPDREVTAVRKVDVRRGGVIVRTLRVVRLERSRASARLDAPAPARAAHGSAAQPRRAPFNPATAINWSSFATSAFPVVSSFSP